MSLGSVWRRQLLLSGVGVLILAIFMFPIYEMVLTAVRPRADTYAYPPKLYPRSVDLSAFRSIIENPEIRRYFVNSGIVATGTVLLTLSLAAPAAYGLAHLRVRGKSVLVLISLTSILFPAIMLATPLFVIFSKIGLLNNYVGLVFANVTLALPFAIVVLRPFFVSIPGELIESARIDGCGHWGAFRRIMLPLAAPGLFTTSVFVFLFAWGDLVFALTLITSDDLRPVTGALWFFVGVRETDWSAVMAFSSLAVLPPLMVFLVAQRYVVGGLTAGAVKQ
jgi:multiple sugar transport system permease protein